MKIHEIMGTEVSTIEMDKSVAEAASRMKETGASSLIVTENSVVIGVISERDLVLGCLTEGHVSFECGIANHMKEQRKCCSPDMEVGDAAMLMMDRDVSDLAVVSGDKIVGMVTHDDVCRAVDRDMTYVA